MPDIEVQSFDVETTPTVSTPSAASASRFMCCCTCVDRAVVECRTNRVYGGGFQFCYDIENATSASYIVTDRNSVIYEIGDIPLDADGNASDCWDIPAELYTNEALGPYEVTNCRLSNDIVFTVSAANECGGDTCTSTFCCEELPFSGSNADLAPCEAYNFAPHCGTFDYIGAYRDTIDPVFPTKPLGQIEVAVSGLSGGLAPLNGTYVLGCSDGTAQQLTERVKFRDFCADPFVTYRVGQILIDWHISSQFLAAKPPPTATPRVTVKVGVAAYNGDSDQGPFDGPPWSVITGAPSSRQVYTHNAAFELEIAFLKINECALVDPSCDPFYEPPGWEMIGTGDFTGTKIIDEGSCSGPSPWDVCGDDPCAGISVSVTRG